MGTDLKHAFRLLRRAPGFACLAVLLLALGLGLTTAMFSIVDAWLFEPLPFRDPGRLAIAFKAEAQRPTEPKIFVSYRDWEVWARASRSFESLAAVFWRSWEAPDPGTRGIFGMIVSATLFGTLGVAPERGRTFRASDAGGPPVAVISHALWQQRFGGAADIVGRSISLSGKLHQIVGVMPAAFELRIIDQANATEIYALMQNEETWRPGGKGPIAVIGRLKPGITVAAAQSELQAIQTALDQRYADNPKGYPVLLSGLQQDNTRSVRASLWIAAAAAGFVLLIVCANVGGLLLGRGLEREHEIAVRAALGSGRGRIVRQLLTENAVIAALGGQGGLLLAAGALKVFAAVNPLGRMPANQIALHGRTLCFAATAAVVSALLFGLAPALQASKDDLNGMIKAGRGIAGGLRALRLQGLLVSGQVALSMLLLVGAALMIQTLVRLESHPLGFQPEGLTLADVAIPRTGWNEPAQKQVLYRQVLDRLSAIPGVQSAALGNLPPLAEPFANRFWIQGRGEDPEEKAPKAGQHVVSAGYFATLEIPVLEGRAFTEFDSATSEPVAIVNSMAVRQWFGGRSPLGQHIKYKDDAQWQTVVGVVGDTASTFYNRLDWLNEPAIYYPLKQVANTSTSPVARQIYALLRGGTPEERSIRTALAAIDPSLRPGRVLPVEQLVADALGQPRLRTRLLALGSALSLLLASVGIYGVMALAVSRRKREIGIRIALGAQHRDVVRMMVKQGAWLAAAGIAAGMAAALLFAKMLAGLLYGVKPTDAGALFPAAALLFAAILVAALLPARRAAQVDPMDALRQD